MMAITRRAGVGAQWHENQEKKNLRFATIANTVQYTRNPEEKKKLKNKNVTAFDF